MRPIILNCEPGGYSADARRILADFCELDELLLDRKHLLECIHKYDGLIVRLGHRIDLQVLEKATNLKVIATATTGLNHIDLAEAKRRNITVISLKGEREFLDTIYATAEHTWALLLALVRRIPFAMKSVLSGEWDRDQFRGSELHGKTLGIVGYGRLGSKVARYGLAFGMRVLACDSYVDSFEQGVRRVSLDELVTESDIVSLHVPCSVQTRGMIDHHIFVTMKRGALLINTSRGEVINEVALLEALRDGRVGGAALDVLCGEYGDDANRLMSAQLLRYAREHMNLLISPHIGGATVESMKKTEVFIATKMRESFEQGLLEDRRRV